MTRAGLKHGCNHNWKEQDLRQTLRKRRNTFFNMSEYFGALSSNRIRPYLPKYRHFGYDPGDPTQQFWKESQSVWFDDIVVATDYIGPIKK